LVYTGPFSSPLESSMKLLFAAMAVLLAMPAQAELYKCSKNGRNVYQAKPCDLENPEKPKVKK